MRKFHVLAGLAALGLLGGCQTLDQLAQPAAPVVAAPSHPTYCYRTLAAVNCYLTPRPGDTLVGVDVPPPAAPAARAGKAAEPPPPTPSAAEAAAQPMPMPPPRPAVAAEPASREPARLSPYGQAGKPTPPPAATPNDPIYGYPPAQPAAVAQ